MRRTVLIMVALCSITGLTASAAIAARPASESEAVEMAAAAKRFSTTHGGPPSDKWEVKETRVSTIDPIWAYGVMADYNDPPQPPIETPAIFKRAGDYWTYAASASAGAVGFGLPIPLKVQIELMLPTFAKYTILGENPYLRDSSQRFKNRPHEIRLELATALINLVNISGWQYWPMNRAAESLATGTSTVTNYRGHVFRQRVKIELKQYMRCRRRWVFKELNFYPVGRPWQGTDLTFGCQGRAIKHEEFSP